MTKLVCGKIDCKYLGENYVCQKEKVRMLYCFNKDKEYLSCKSFQEEPNWKEYVQGIQEKVNKGEAVI